MKKRYLIFIIILIFCPGIFQFSMTAVGLEDSKAGLENPPKDTMDNILKLENHFDYILIGLTEIYYGHNDLEGNLETIEGNEGFKEDVDKGRVSFYLQGKIKGKYLFTVWMDTGEEELDQLFSNLNGRRIDNPFARLDPEKYYPVYGDNSTLSSSINTAGKIYLCLESEDFKAIFGNYRISYVQNKLINYNRNLYGLNINYENDFSINTFWNQPFSLLVRDELKLTGGMLYYLSHDDLIVSSEELTLELRDGLSGRVKETQELIRGIDYEINYLQGRIILKKKMGKLPDENLIEDGTEKDNYYLIANYNYDYNFQAGSNNDYGLETGYQLRDNLNINATYLRHQDKGGELYQIIGTGLDYCFSNNSDKNSNLRLNWAQSENILSGKYISDDGGLNYEEVRLNSSSDRPTAWSLEYEKESTDKSTDKSKDKSTDEKKNRVTFYAHKKDKGFSSGSQQVKEDTEGLGFKVSQEEKNIKNTISFDNSKAEDKNTIIINFNREQKYSDKLNLEWELENKDVNFHGNQNSLTGAMGFDYQLAVDKKIYGSQQLIIAKSGGLAGVNMTILGGEVEKGKWRFSAEGKTGDSKSLKFNTGYQLNESSQIYTSIKKDFNNSERGIETAVGTESRLNQNLKVYGEHRTDNDQNKTETGNVLGIDYTPSNNWQLSLDYSRSDINQDQIAGLNREIVSIGSSYNDQDINFSKRIEYREDRNIQNGNTGNGSIPNGSNKDLKQLLMIGDLSWNYNQELTLLSELEYSMEKEIVANIYKKATIGAAYRPVNNDRLNLLGKYTYLVTENLKVIEDEFNYPAQRSQVYSLDTVYDLTQKWQLAEKIAYKNGEVKLNTIKDDWTSSQTYLWINRINYICSDDLKLFTEYRLLENKLAQDRKSGFKIGAYKDFPHNVKLGLGYNFTEFNDDLTTLNYESRGLFINIIKVW